MGDSVVEGRKVEVADPPHASGVVLVDSSLEESVGVLPLPKKEDTVRLFEDVAENDLELKRRTHRLHPLGRQVRERLKDESDLRCSVARADDAAPTPWGRRCVQDAEPRTRHRASVVGDLPDSRRGRPRRRSRSADRAACTGNLPPVVIRRHASSRFRLLASWLIFIDRAPYRTSRDCQLVEGSALLPREIDAPDRSKQARHRIPFNQRVGAEQTVVSRPREMSTDSEDILHDTVNPERTVGAERPT